MSETLFGYPIHVGIDLAREPDLGAISFGAVAALVHSIDPHYRRSVEWQMNPRAYRAMQRAAAARRDMKWKSKGWRRHARRLKARRPA